MYIDTFLRVSAAQAVTATAVSTNTIDLAAVTPRRQVGTGEALGFGLSVGVAADITTGDETYQVNIIQDEDPALGSPVVIAEFIRTAAQLFLGSLHFFPLPQGWPTERYIGLQYVTAGTTPTVTVTAWFTSHALFSLLPQNYAKGFTT